MDKRIEWIRSGSFIKIIGHTLIRNLHQVILNTSYMSIQELQWVEGISAINFSSKNIIEAHTLGENNTL